MPVPAKLTLQDGTVISIRADSVGNGYNYEAAEVVQCIERERPRVT